MLPISWKTRRQLKQLYKKELQSPIHVPFSEKLKMWRTGFLSESKILYRDFHNRKGEYLSDFARFMRTPFINGSYAEFLDNKLLFETFFGGKLPIPRNLGVIHAGVFIPLRNHISISSLESLCDYIEECGSLVLKPFDGGGGADVYIVRRGQNKDYTINSAAISRNELIATLKKHAGLMMACEYADQAAYSRNIYPKTTNTVRILTLIDPDTGKAFIATAVHRFGNHRSEPVDNWSQGALSVKVDIATGELGEGVGYPSDGRLVFHQSHPDTKAAIKGVVIPNWHLVCQKLLQAASEFPFIPYVGWDVVVTDEGFKVIEGNNFSDVNLLQVHGPLLTDPRVRRFYEYHKVII